MKRLLDGRMEGVWVFGKPFSTVNRGVRSEARCFELNLSSGISWPWAS